MVNLNREPNSAGRSSPITDETGIELRKIWFSFLRGHRRSWGGSLKLKSDSENGMHLINSFALWKRQFWRLSPRGSPYENDRNGSRWFRDVDEPLAFRVSSLTRLNLVTISRPKQIRGRIASSDVEAVLQLFQKQEIVILVQDRK